MIASEPLAWPGAIGLDDSARSLPRRLLRDWRWELALTIFAVVAAAIAFWVTLDAGFLAHPAWLAVQKADFILGPIGVGLYWLHRRPQNRFGLLLIVLGLCGVPYILESSTEPTLFALGVEAEFLPFIMLTIVILAFPTGRIHGLPERLIVALLAVMVVVTGVVTLIMSHLAPGLSISGCRVACPRTGLGAFSPRFFHIDDRFLGALPVALPLLIAGVIAWRFATGTPARRRALAIGAPIALLFLFSDAAYHALFLFAPNGLAPSARPIQDMLQWADAATRSFVWYGFLFALVAAELFAGSVLRTVVRRSLARPSLGELEGMLREPLGDPGLRLAFWLPHTREWVRYDRAVLEPAAPGQTLTKIDREGRPAAAIVHDAQLADDPELLQAAGAAVLLALENAELDAAWKESLRDLADSRARLTSAGDRQRRRLERDLHDGAQQRFIAASIDLALADDLAGHDSALGERIGAARQELEEGLQQLREVAHGIYPTALARLGLARALNSLTARYPGSATLTEADTERFPPELEAAVYYCCLEALQNAAKHAGSDAHVWIRLSANSGQLRLEVRDNGPGFDLDAVQDGDGLQNLRDRMGAVGGRVEITSRPGHGTLVAATAPLNGRPIVNGLDQRARGRPPDLP